MMTMRLISPSSGPSILPKTGRRRVEWSWIRCFQQYTCFGIVVLLEKHYLHLGSGDERDHFNDGLHSKTRHSDALTRYDNDHT